MCPITFRSIQTIKGTPSRMKPRTMWTLITASISVNLSTRLLQLREEAVHLLRRDVFMVALVHHDDRRRAAGAEALDRYEREAAVLRGFAVPDPEALLDLALEPVPPVEATGKIAAHLEQELPDRLLMEHRVEGDHLEHRLRRDLQERRHLRLGLAAQPPLVSLRHVERGNQRG